ncbi:MAG: histidine kinase [Acidimicrobiia bacterium]|nr:histidine kinase [Acidimicrobiia bacterium]
MERTLTEVRDGTRDRDAIDRFIKVDCGFTVAGLAFLFAVKVLFIESASLLIIAPFLLLLLGCLMAAGRLINSGGSILLSLVLIVLGNWSIAIAVSIIVPFLWPVMALTVMMPVVLATPFLERSQPLWIVVAAAIVAGTSSALGLLNDGYGAMSEVGSRMQIVIVIATLTVQIVPIGLIVSQNNRLQHESLVRATDLNARLLRSQEDLAASRRRVVVAGDLERQRIERNLHDGAQQRLLAIGVRLRMLEADTDHLPEVNGPIEALIGELDAAIEDVRDLAQGIYPPMLESLGLAEALSVVAQRSTIPIHSQLARIGRLDPSIETALYFTALEALTNAAKHAPSATVYLRLVDDGPTVSLSIIDDGPGFVVEEVVPKPAENFGDRMAAVGGRLSIISQLGAGTTVTAVAPKVLTQPASVSPEPQSATSTEFASAESTLTTL